jgi:hypothetical protein
MNAARVKWWSFPQNLQTRVRKISDFNLGEDTHTLRDVLSFPQFP